MILVVGDVIDDNLVQARAPMDWGGETRARITSAPGGSAANQAAWLGALGAPVRFAGRVSAGDVERHSAELRHFGVDARLTGDPTAPTGSIVVLVNPDGERDFLSDRGANLRLASADLPDALLDGVTHLHLSGYSFFEPGPRWAVADLMRRARARGISLSADPSSASMLAISTGFFAWTRGVRLIFPNLDEGRALTGLTEPEPIADALVEHYPVVALKLGADGVLLATRDGLRLREPAHSGEAADTTGAGDAFCAGFLSALAADEPLKECVQRALSAAALAVAQVGARP